MTRTIIAASIALAIGLMGGCRIEDHPFGVIDAAGDGAAGDGAPLPDAQAVIVLDRRIPLRIAVTDRVEVQFTIQSAAGVLVPWAVTSGGGVFGPASGFIATNGNGIGVLITNYIAPDTGGDRAHVLLFGPVSVPFTTAVRTLTPIGESGAGYSSGGQYIVSNYLYAQKARLASAAVLMQLAVGVDSGGPNARMALYSDQGGAPLSLLASTSVFTLVAGANERAITAPLDLPAGDYWIATNFETQAAVRLDNTRSTNQAYKALPFAAALPPTLSASPAVDKVLNYYMLVAD